MVLDVHLGSKDADETTGGGQHDEHPYVQLDGGPVVAVDAGDMPVVNIRRAGGDGGSGGHSDKRGLRGRWVLLSEDFRGDPGQVMSPFVYSYKRMYN